MKNLIYRNSYRIISILFLIGLLLVVFVREHINNELLIAIINYYFWYSSGLLSGSFLIRRLWIAQSKNEMDQKSKENKREFENVLKNKNN